MDPPEVSAIDVLLVDDDAEWLRLASSSLSDRDEAVTVLTATSGAEALDVLEREAIDCVVCDYRMPGMDGLTVLERIREEGSTVPFILVTGSGSEVVASQAIAADVTDYFVKEPTRDQSEPLAKRIRSAVTAHRTREALVTARERFRALFENVPDPVAIVDADGEIYGLNEAFERTFGVTEDAADGRGVEDCIDAAGELTGEDRAVSELALSTEAGERNFLARRFPLDAAGAGYVFTDVTDHRERQRHLERALELDADVRELFLSVSTRAELERAFCDAMLETGDRLFSVVADLEGNDTVSVRESASAADAGEADQPPLGGEGDPLAAAIHTRETRYVPDVEQRSDDWSDRAGAADVGSAFVVPIERNGVPDGAFGIYFGTADALDADRRERVADLVSSLGDAVHLVERMSALAADSVVRVRLSVEGEDPLTGAAAVADGGIAVEVVRQVDGNTSMYVDVASEDEAAVSDRLSAEDGIDSVEAVHGGDPARLHVTADAGTLPGIAVERGASVDSLEVRSDGYAAAVDVGPSGDVSGVVEAIEDRYDRTTVRSIRSHEREDGGVTGGHLSELTDRQLAALRTAYVEGYFETPRERSAEEIAGSMSIAGSTFLQHLRAAERKLLSSLLSVDSSADGTD